MTVDTLESSRIDRKHVRKLWEKKLVEIGKIDSESKNSKENYCFACGEYTKVFNNHIKPRHSLKYSEEGSIGGEKLIPENIHLLCIDCKFQASNRSRKVYEDWFESQTAFRKAVKKADTLKKKVLGLDKRSESKEEPSKKISRSDKATKYASSSRKSNTEKTYSSSLQDFRKWCNDNGYNWLPSTEEAIGFYIAERAEELALATLEVRLAAIATIHREEGFDPPVRKDEGPLQEVWKGIVREKGRDQDSAPRLSLEGLKKVIDQLPEYSAGDDGPTGRLTLKSLRDKALLLVGWAGALRRSELVALQTEDVQFVEGEGAKIRIDRSKNDQEGEGHVKGLPYGEDADTCPVTALKEWMQAAQKEVGGPFKGDIFRRFYRGQSIAEDAITGQSVTDILKDHLQDTNLEADEYSSHSLRRGFINRAIVAGAHPRRVKEHSGHDSWSAFNTYVEEAGAFQDNPVEEVGL
ncbi:site-specific recombinase XerD [Salinibacter ruber]|nr:site-specific recombinase XerD [Salinibacter ruber]